MQHANKAALSTLLECLKSLQLDSAFTQPVLEYDPEAIVALTNIDQKIYNSIFLKNPTDPSKLIHELTDLQKNLAKPLTVWITEETNSTIESTIKKHCDFLGPFYNMLLDLKHPNLSPTTENMSFIPVTSEAEAHQFAKIFSEGFNFANLQSPTTKWATMQYQSDNPISLNFIAYLDDVAAGVCSLMLDRQFKEFKAGGFYNACVLPPFRKSGVGTTMACHRVKLAQTLGLEHLSIVLMPDAMARGYCKRLGFKETGTMQAYTIG